jgi:hypothetical protein
MPELLDEPPAPVLPEYRGIKAVKSGFSYVYKVNSSNDLLVIRAIWGGSDFLGWEVCCDMGDVVFSERFIGWATIDETVAAYDRLWASLLAYVKEQRDHQATVLRGWDRTVDHMEALTVTAPVFWDRLNG